MSDDHDFTDDMDQLAAEIAIAAGSADVALADKIDAFKALMPYYIQQLKKKGDKPSTDDDLPNFESFAARLQEHDDGEREPGIRSGRRNGSGHSDA